MFNRFFLAGFFLLLAGCTTRERIRFVEKAQEPADRSSIGNGSDKRRPDSGAAWFLGKVPASYCYRLPSDFLPSDTAVVEDDIASAIEQWRTYLSRKRINDLTWHPDRGAPESPPLVLEATLSQPCNGTQDIEFLIGVRTPEVDSAARQFENPKALSVRTQYDPTTGRGRGFVYVDEPKQNPHGRDWAGFFARLLHEWGHVAGCGHVAGTVMDENLEVVLDSMPWDEHGVSTQTLYTIDAEHSFSQWERELLYCEKCPRDRVPGRLMDEDGALKKILGEDIHLSLGEASLSDARDRLVMETSAGFLLFEIIGLVPILTHRGDVPLFKTAFRPSAEAPWMTRESFTTSVSYQGTLVTPSGARGKAFLNRNTRRKHFGVYLQEGSQRPSPIFLEEPQGRLRIRLP